MNKIHAALFALLTVFGLSGNSAADTFDQGQLLSPGSYQFGNSTTDGTLAPLGSGLVTDDWLFQVNLPSSFGAATTAISVSTSGAFTSFNTRLSVFSDGWVEIASNTGVLFGSTWLSRLQFSPLSPSPTQYMLTVFGNKQDGDAGYGGNISVSPVTPVPEPEIYVMLAAGLGLMGFVARRRKQHDDAVI